MSKQEPTIQQVKLSAVGDRVAALVERVRQAETRVVVVEAGVAVAALVSAADLERLARLDRDRAERFRVVEEARQAFHGVPPEEIDREADRAVAELRSDVGGAP